MKDKYFIKSDRYNYTHSFIKNNDTNHYVFKPQEDWMQLYVNYNTDNSILSVDTDGGPYLTKGWVNHEIKVKDIIFENNLITFIIEDV